MPDQRPVTTARPGPATADDWVAIAQLVTTWGAHRDAHRWEALAATFAPGATLDIAWFHGSAERFVAACRARATASGPRSKHVIATPIVTAVGERALAETDAQLLLDSPDLELGAVTHVRFLDRLVRIAGAWKIHYRTSVYDLCAFTLPSGRSDVDLTELRRFPREYAALAYLLSRGGYPVSLDCPTRGSAREDAIRHASARWLHSTS